MIAAGLSFKRCGDALKITTLEHVLIFMFYFLISQFSFRQ